MKFDFYAGVRELLVEIGLKSRDGGDGPLLAEVDEIGEKLFPRELTWAPRSGGLRDEIPGMEGSPDKLSFESFAYWASMCVLGDPTLRAMLETLLEKMIRARCDWGQLGDLKTQQAGAKLFGNCMVLASRPELTAIAVETLAAKSGDLVTLAPLMERLEQFSATRAVEELWTTAWDFDADEAVDEKEGRAKDYYRRQKHALFQYLKTHPRESVRVVAHGVLEEPFTTTTIRAARRDRTVRRRERIRCSPLVQKRTKTVALPPRDVDITSFGIHAVRPHWRWTEEAGLQRSLYF